MTGPSSELQPEDVRRYYDEWTAKYLEFFGESIQAHRPAREEDLLDYLLTQAGIRDGQHILDAGCGICGPARHFAAARRVTIDALTISPVQAEIARERNRAAALDDRIHVTVGDFHDLTAIYGRETFDLVYFLESLSHSARPLDVLRSVYEVLKPGGIVYVKDFYILVRETAEEQARVLKAVERVDVLFRVKTPWAEDMRTALREAGFLPLFVTPCRFEDDRTVWQMFERKHQFDLFGGEASHDWSQWLEFRSQKP